MTVNVNKTHYPFAGGNRWVQTTFYASYWADEGITGNVFWVDSLIGVDDAQHGFSPEAPFASITFACTQCKADNNDLLVVMPGHVEVIGSVATTMTVPGITVRGLGIGRQRGTITYSNAAGYFNLDQPRTVIDNLTFVGTGVAAVTQMVGVSAADCTIQNCEFDHANATNQAATVILTTAGANRFWLNSNDFHGLSNAGTNYALTLVGGSDIEIYNNTFQGAYHVSGGIVRVLTTAVVNLVVNQNIFQNYTALNTKSFVDGPATSTGQLRNNMMQILSGTAPLTAAAMSWVGQNYYANAVATAGTLI